MPGLALWLNAQNASSVLTSVSPEQAAGSGQTVRCWKDDSGNGRHLEQTNGTNQPTVLANWRPGRHAVTFDGVNDVLTYAGQVLPYNAGAEWTIALAGQFISASGGVIEQGANNGFADATTALIYRSGGTTLLYTGAGSGIDSNCQKTSDTISSVRIFRQTSTVISIRSGGVDGTTAARRPDCFDANAFRLGGWFTMFSQMHIAELLCYSGSLSAADVTRLEKWLTDKYGL